jgi:hypothetical protein
LAQVGVNDSVRFPAVAVLIAAHRQSVARVEGAWRRNRLSVLMTLSVEESLIGSGCASEARIHARLVHGGEAGAADPLHALRLPGTMRGEHARGEFDRK